VSSSLPVQKKFVDAHTSVHMMFARLAIVASGCFVLGVAVRPARQEPAPTADQSKTLDAAAACGVDVNETYAQVESAVGTANTSVLAFLDQVTSAIETASASLYQAQSAAASALMLAGLDDTFLADTVSAVGVKARATLVVVNDTNDNLKAKLQGVLSEYAGERDTINAELADAVDEATEAAAADAAAADANATSLRRKHAAVSASPKESAASAIATLNKSADKLIEMLTQLNTTVLSVSTDVLTKVNTSALAIQDTLQSGIDSFPANVPSAVTSKIDGIFDKVFAVIDAISPSKLDQAMSKPMAAATKQMAAFQSCIQPLGAMVADLDAAWPGARSWPLLSLLLAAFVARTALQ